MRSRAPVLLLTRFRLGKARCLYSEIYKKPFRVFSRKGFFRIPSFYGESSCCFGKKGMHMIFQTSLGERRPEKIALLFFLAFFGFAWFFMGLCPKPRRVSAAASVGALFVCHRHTAPFCKRRAKTSCFALWQLSVKLTQSKTYRPSRRAEAGRGSGAWWEQYRQGGRRCGACPHNRPCRTAQDWWCEQ